MGSKILGFFKGLFVGAIFTLLAFSFLFLAAKAVFGAEPSGQGIVGYVEGSNGSSAIVREIGTTGKYSFTFFLPTPSDKHPGPCKPLEDIDTCYGAQFSHWVKKHGMTYEQYMRAKYGDKTGDLVNRIGSQ